MKTTLLKLSFLFCFAFSLSGRVQAQATLISDFEFTSSLVDAQGNGTMNPYNNSNVSYAGGGLEWTAAGDPGGGLIYNVADAMLTENDFSVAITFRYAETSGYRKIMDFTGGGDDAGVYVNDQLRIYGNGNYGDVTLGPDTLYTILFTLSAADDSARLYLLEGNTLLLQSVAEDPIDELVPYTDGTDRYIGFFHDDTTTADEYATAGMVDRIRVWNGIATLSDLIIASVPDPNATAFSLAPNPAQDRVRIRFASPQEGLLEVVDVQGRLLHSEWLNRAESRELLTGDWQPGLYFVRIGTQCEKLIIR